MMKKDKYYYSTENHASRASSKKYNFITFEVSAYTEIQMAFYIITGQPNFLRFYYTWKKLHCRHYDY